jgi:hypothetical protein
VTEGVSIGDFFLVLVASSVGSDCRCSCRWLLFVAGCWLSILAVIVGVAVGGCCLLLVVGCRVLAVIVGVAVGGCCLLLVVGCRVLTVIVGFAVGGRCLVLFVGSRLSSTAGC